MCLEKIVRQVDEKFYINNYGTLKNEQDAEKYALNEAIKEILEPNYFKGLKGLLKDYILLENEKVNKTLIDCTTIVSTGQNKKCKTMQSGERIKILEYIAAKYIKQYPNECLKLFPILKIAFNEDGSRKESYQILKEAIPTINSIPAKSFELREFYKLLITQRYCDNSTIEEIQSLKKFYPNESLIDEIIKQKTDIKNDKVNKKNKNNLDKIFYKGEEKVPFKEKIAEIIKNVRNIISKRRNVKTIEEPKIKQNSNSNQFLINLQNNIETTNNANLESMSFPNRKREIYDHATENLRE